MKKKIRKVVEKRLKKVEIRKINRREKDLQKFFSAFLFHYLFLFNIFYLYFVFLAIFCYCYLITCFLAFLKREIKRRIIIKESNRENKKESNEKRAKNRKIKTGKNKKKLYR